jgi:tetratricopeptide (TPR) repeat protein
MAGLLDTGSRFGVTNVAASLAESCEYSGAITDAFEAIEGALRQNPDELIFRPYILQLRGEMRLKEKQIDRAETDLRESIALAQRMGAKAFELRSTMSLAQLLRDTRRRDEASTILAQIYNWFTEGFDTADLKEAKALLDELNR